MDTIEKKEEIWEFPFTREAYEEAEKQRLEMKAIWENTSENDIIRERVQKILISSTDNMIDEIINSLYEIAIHKRKNDKFLLNSFSRFFGEGE